MNPLEVRAKVSMRLLDNAQDKQDVRERQNQPSGVSDM